jgi:hypothetical protein
MIRPALTLDCRALPTVAWFAQQLQVALGIRAAACEWDHVIELDVLLAAAFDTTALVAAPDGMTHVFGYGLSPTPRSRRADTVEQMRLIIECGIVGVEASQVAASTCQVAHIDEESGLAVSREVLKSNATLFAGADRVVVDNDGRIIESFVRKGVRLEEVRCSRTMSAPRQRGVRPTLHGSRGARRAPLVVRVALLGVPPTQIYREATSLPRLVECPKAKARSTQTRRSLARGAPSGGRATV